MANMWAPAAASTAALFIFVTLQTVTGKPSIDKSSANHLPKIEVNATVDDKVYYINTDGLAWNGSFAACEAMGLSMVSFDSEGEFVALQSWLESNGMAAQWYWTSGWRPLGTWQWSSTGAAVADSTEYWIEGQPSVPVDGPRACMSFAPGLGWDDDTEELCLEFYTFATICE